MRNLRNRKHARLRLKEPITATAWDASDDSIIVTVGPNENHTITLSRIASGGNAQDCQQVIASWDAPPPNPDISRDQILELHCFSDTKSICLILAGGDIVVAREEPQPGEELIEIMGSVDAGVRAAAWSPDEEILILSTGADTMLFMTTEFESLANLTMTSEDLHVSNHVSVGWGKKETQFKGRGVAKALRDPTIPEHVDEGTLSELDDGRTTISWRGDGQYVAINSVLSDAGDFKRRIIRVYSREGTLESVSEPVNGLEGALSWKPSGQLIAGVRRLQDKIDVVFFERNGLRHGDFSLRLSPEEISTIGTDINLKWNTDSTLLAVSMKDRIQLWTMGNYHYYLKQELLFDLSLEDTACTTWHPEKPLQLACWNGADLRSLAYDFEVSRGSISPPQDFGLVAVIDGRNLKITPLRIANIPPPMAFDEVELPNNALDVAVNLDGTEISVLHHSSVSTWSCDYSVQPAKMASLKSAVDIVERGDTDKGVFSVTRSERSALLMRTDHDRIFYSTAGNDSAQSNGDMKLPSAEDPYCSNTAWTGTESDILTFQLSNNGNLQIQRNAESLLRIPGCTSYITTPMHLIYTTSQHLLKFVHLHAGELEVPEDEPEKDERCRSIERGAKIVTVMPSIYALVLQMPRGNLETIYPRALVLAGIRQSLRNRDYRKAFLTCRTQRVDMNILHDYSPDQFLADAGLFIKQVKKIEHIDLFLSSLSEADVSQTMYRETLAPTEAKLANGLSNGDTDLPPISTASKMNKICDTFLRVLQVDSTSRLQNIVTAHVCKNPPDLESGLRLISNLRNSGDQEGLEQAVEHICFLADVNQLYDTALGLYDLDVTLLVAQQSQKDPREYLPYLQSLHEMEAVRQKFTIDNDLKRYQMALSHLHVLQTFNELKEYTVRHELYATAIELFRYDSSRLTELMKLYADYLSNHNRMKEAGIAYEYIACHKFAYEAFRSVTMWRECLYNAQLVPISAAELLDLAQDLSSSLEEAKDFTGAAAIHLDYLDDLQAACRLLCKAYSFAEAMRLLASKARPHLIGQVIDPALVEDAAMMTEQLADMKSQLGAQLPRLRELRQKKAEDPMAFLDGAEGGDGDVPDNISLAPTDASTTAGTLMTRYTNRSTGTLATNATRKTSKNRRREERKRARGKKGTVYEEEYLVNSIARLIDRLNDIGDDVGKLVDGLMRRAMRERAVAVQAAMDELVATVKDCVGEVWASHEEDVQDPEPYSGSRPWGGQGVLWDALTAARREAPTLRSFERLTLIP